MGFFENRPADPNTEPVEEEREPRPPWTGPAVGIIPVVLPQSLVLISNDEVILTVDRFRVFPTGMELSVSIEFRESQRALDPPWEMFHSGGGEAELLRLGVEFADGRSWSNLDSDQHPRPDGPTPVGPVMWGGGGGGGGNSYEMSYWLWPLPPAGELKFFAEWPSKGIPETVMSMDANQIQEAANKADVRWPDAGNWW